MKFVYKTNDSEQAYSIQNLLEENGVPANVMENSMRNRGSHIPQGTEVRIYINEQYNDAMQLINNPKHEVKNPINIEEFYSHLDSEQVKERLFNYNSAFLKFGIAVIAAFIIIMVVLI